MLLQELPPLEAGIGQEVTLPPVELRPHVQTFYAIGRSLIGDTKPRPNRGGSGPPGGFDGQPGEDVTDGTVPDPQPRHNPVQ